jgi:RAT1-interacting protein
MPSASKTQCTYAPPRFRGFCVDGRYIEEEKDFEARRAKDRMHELAMFGGYKFESLCTLEKTWDESTREEIETRNEDVVDNIQQYCSVVRTQLGSSTIIMGGEVDCLWGTVPLRLDIPVLVRIIPYSHLFRKQVFAPPLRSCSSFGSFALALDLLLTSLLADYKPDPPENPVPHYMELKTSKQLTTQNQIHSFEQHKLLKFWAQSFLLGIPRIVIGFRGPPSALNPNTAANAYYAPNASTVLVSTQMLETMRIPAQIQGRGAGMWNGNVCINFTAGFLEFLKEVISEDTEGEQQVWSLRFLKGGREVSVLRKEGVGSFLTEEFVRWKKNGD